jgi:exodeoxyribonuclease VII large subunit
LLEVTLIPTAVQGQEAEGEIVSALEAANQLSPDLIIITRGGGSLEDLWSFNLESVARAIIDCDPPVISAVGHEIDFTIADFVADVRAPTPSAAAEIAVPDSIEISNQINEFTRLLINIWDRTRQVFELTIQNTALRLISPRTLIEQAYQKIDDATNRLSTSVESALQSRAIRLSGAKAQLRILGPGQSVQNSRSELATKAYRLTRSVQEKLSKDKERLRSLTRILESVSPLPTIARGYAIIQDAQSKAVLTKQDELSIGQTIVTNLSDSSFTSTIETIDDKTTLGLEKR